MSERRERRTQRSRTGSASAARERRRRSTRARLFNRLVKHGILQPASCSKPIRAITVAARTPELAVVFPHTNGALRVGRKIMIDKETMPFVKNAQLAKLQNQCKLRSGTKPISTTLHPNLMHLLGSWVRTQRRPRHADGHGWLSTFVVLAEEVDSGLSPRGFELVSGRTEETPARQ